MSDLILAIDQGTTGSKALLVDRGLRVVAEKIVGFPQHYPKPGWVEHDLEQIWTSVQKALRAVLPKAGRRRIACIGITNQRETICFWDRRSGKPLARAIV